MTRFVLVAAIAAFSAASVAQGPTCTTSLSAAGCGPALEITFTPQGASGGHDLTLVASGLHPNAFGLMVWGNTPIHVPLWGNCALLTDFAWGHLINLDAQGSWSWSRNWPASALTGFYIQVGSFVFDTQGGLEVWASDCIRAQCQ